MPTKRCSSSTQCVSTSVRCQRGEQRGDLDAGQRAGGDGEEDRARFRHLCVANVASSAATLTLDSGPLVTLNPSSQTVCPGNVTFSAAASGSPAPTVQWQVSTDGGVTFNDIPGATSPTLTFSAGAADDGKEYRARFNNLD